jgi:hypothetical protein
MLAFPDTRLVKISTPYMKSGVLYQDFKNYWAQDSPDVLLWRAASVLMNPSLKRERLERERRLDPTRYGREYEAEFQEDLDTFLPAAWVDDGVVTGRHELPACDGYTYVLTVDPSGAGLEGDEFVVNVLHAEGEGADRVVVQDLLKAWASRRSGQVDLEGIVGEIAVIANRYRCQKIFGDRYSAGWVKQAFERHDLRYNTDHGLDRSKAYLDAEPLFAQGRIRLLDDPALIRQLKILERRPRPGGRTVVDHPSGHHDDRANALCLGAALAKPPEPDWIVWGGAPGPEDEARRQADADIAGWDDGRLHAAETRWFKQ